VQVAALSIKWGNLHQTRGSVLLAHATIREVDEVFATTPQEQPLGPCTNAQAVQIRAGYTLHEKALVTTEKDG
jgi:hypothetical protein